MITRSGEARNARAAACLARPPPGRAACTHALRRRARAFSFPRQRPALRCLAPLPHSTARDDEVSSHAAGPAAGAARRTRAMDFRRLHKDALTEVKAAAKEAKEAWPLTPKSYLKAILTRTSSALNDAGYQSPRKERAPAPPRLRASGVEAATAAAATVAHAAAVAHPSAAMRRCGTTARDAGAVRAAAAAVAAVAEEDEAGAASEAPTETAVAASTERTFADCLKAPPTSRPSRRCSV